MKKLQLKDIIFYATAIIILLVAIYALYNTSQPAEATYLEVRSLFKNEQVSEFVLEGNILQMKTKDGSRIVYTIPYIDWFYYDMGELLNEQMDRGILTRVNLLPGQQQDWWMMYVPYLVIMVIVLGFWFFMMNRAQGGASGGGGAGAAKWGRARTRLASEEKNKITFSDVAGAVEEKEELQEIVDFLKAPRRFTELGARIPKGVLMVGPPGTGKTYLAKAVAGEAGVQFLSNSGSDFVELYVGIGASRVRTLFEDAKKIAPCIVFIDEIDAVGRHRGAGMGGGHDEREQTLNQLLVEMDGFSNNEGVIVMAATNRQDILDPALLRPGRFDRQIYVGLPDVREREAVLKIHARKKPLDADVDLSTVAKTCGGFTPADLENLMNESALLAVRRGRKAITMEDIEESMIKVIAGPAKRTRVISDKEKRLTAYHEAGHAIMIKYLEHHDPVHQISIIPRGTAGGMTIFLPEEDKHFMSKSEMQDHIVSLLGGRVAEKLVLNDISTGASNDIERATQIARHMVTRYGMSDAIGPINYGSDRDEVFLGRDFTSTRSYSDTTATSIDAEIKRIIDEAYKRCEDILKREIKHLHAVAEYLLRYETMDADTFNRYFEDGYLPSIDNVIPEPKRKERALPSEPATDDKSDKRALEFVDELFSQNKVEDEDDAW